MTNKGYIVANEQQEREVLEKLEQQGLVWVAGGEKPTEWLLKKIGTYLYDFPYVLIDEGKVSWANLSQLTDEEIVYDGRKEEQMNDKYVVSQEFMNELEEWKEKNHLQPHVSFDGQYVSWQDLESISMGIKKWWHEIDINDIEMNNRLIAIIRWLNGEDVFEVEKPKKWVVRSKETDDDNDHWYVRLPNNIDGINDVVYYMSSATLFNTKEEAQSWANSHQEVVEVE